MKPLRGTGKERGTRVGWKAGNRTKKELRIRRGSSEIGGQAAGIEYKKRLVSLIAELLVSLRKQCFSLYTVIEFKGKLGLLKRESGRSKEIPRKRKR